MPFSVLLGYPCLKKTKKLQTNKNELKNESQWMEAKVTTSFPLWKPRIAHKLAQKSDGMYYTRTTHKATELNIMKHGEVCPGKSLMVCTRNSFIVLFCIYSVCHVFVRGFISLYHRITEPMR